MSKSTQLARREFIKSMAKTLGSVGITAAVGETFMAHFLNRAFAQSAPENCYLFFALPGAPPRWLFDLPVNPGSANAGGSFTAGGFGTFIQGGSGVARSILTSFPYSEGGRTTHLPPLWGMGRADSAYTDLLPNITMFRGLDMQINNHSISRYRNVAPVIGGLSLNGALADNSKLSIPGLGDGSGTSRTFKSSKGLAHVNAQMNAANPIEALLRPFRRLPANAALNSQDWENAINQSLAEFEKYATDIGLRPHALDNAYDRSIEMVKGDTYKIAEKWTAVFGKYDQAVKEAFNVDRIKQLFPQAIRADGSAAFSRDNASPLNNADIRNMFVAGSGPRFMAHTFAVAELAITQNLSSTGAFELSEPINYNLGGLFAVTHDQHRIGSVLSTLSTTAFYRGLLNCMTDLTKALKTSGHFNRTVIHVGAEFNRTPRSDFSGSDHGFMGASSLILSGMVKNFALIGNVRRAGLVGTAYTGTWGNAAPFLVDPANNIRQPIMVQDIALTIGRMLGVAPVSQNGYVLLDPQNNWAPFRREANNV